MSNVSSLEAIPEASSATVPPLFAPVTFRSVTARNRIGVSPMCQYSYEDGFSNEWQLVHLGSRAVGGAGIVMVEATAVEARGRITPADLGIWKDEHVPGLARVASFIRQHGAVAGIQLAHAGFKASTDLPWRGGRQLSEAQGGWQTVGPSAISFRKSDNPPHALSIAEIERMVQSFQDGARRALEAGYQFVEIHGAHGYLLHEFLSPISNYRTDEYGGSFDNRVRFFEQVARAIRAVWPEDLPVFARISATDWADGGWDIDQSVELSRRLAALGVDLIDCSSGGLTLPGKIPVGPGYQVAFADRIRRDAGVPTAAVGMITEAHQANEIVSTGQADVVLLAREFLRDAYWPQHAARKLGYDVNRTVAVPIQYQRAW